MFKNNALHRLLSLLLVLTIAFTIANPIIAYASPENAELQEALEEALEEVKEEIDAIIELQTNSVITLHPVKNLYIGDLTYKMENKVTQPYLLPGGGIQTFNFGGMEGLQGIGASHPMLFLLAIIGGLLVASKDTLVAITRKVWDALSNGAKFAFELAVKATKAINGTVLNLSKWVMQEIVDRVRDYVNGTLEAEPYVDFNFTIPALNNLNWFTLDSTDFNNLSNSVEYPGSLRDWNIGRSIKFYSDAGEYTYSVILNPDTGKWSPAINGQPDTRNTQIPVGNAEQGTIRLDTYSNYFNNTFLPYPNRAGVAEAMLVPVAVVKDGVISPRIMIMVDTATGGLEKPIFTYLGWLKLDKLLIGEGAYVTPVVEGTKADLDKVATDLEAINAEEVAIGGVAVDTIEQAIDADLSIDGSIIGGIELPGWLVGLKGILEGLFQGLIEGIKSMLEFLFGGLLGVFAWIGSLIDALMEKVDSWREIELPRVDLFFSYIALIVYRIIMLNINFYAYVFSLYNPQSFPPNNACPIYLSPQVCQSVKFLHNAGIKDVPGFTLDNVVMDSGIDIGITFINFINLIVSVFIAIKLIKILRNKTGQAAEVYEDMVDKQQKDEIRILQSMHKMDTIDAYNHKYGQNKKRRDFKKDNILNNGGKK